VKGHEFGLNLSAEEKRALIALLRTRHGGQARLKARLPVGDLGIKVIFVGTFGGVGNDGNPASVGSF
jgi:hypothetical protein